MSAAEVATLEHSPSTHPNVAALLERAWPRIAERGGSALVGDRVLLVIDDAVHILERRHVRADIERATRRPCPQLAMPRTGNAILVVIIGDEGIAFARLRPASRGLT